MSKKPKAWKLTALFFYLLIILDERNAGYGCVPYTPLPLFLWISNGLSGSRTNEQLFYACLAVIGLTISLINLNSIRTLKALTMDIISFVLLASPIIYVTIVSYDYNLVILFIQLMLCLGAYSVSFYYSVKQFLLQDKIHSEG